MTLTNKFFAESSTLRLALPILVAATISVTPSAWAQPVSGSSLYYRMGGGAPTGKASNKSQIAMRLGLGANLRANYSCGKFDIGLSWSNVMNGISQLGQQITGAIQAGIAALPLYVLQRAQPGLYQLFQNYSAKADALVAASLKSCEEMEAMIKAGKNPYEDWVKLAKGEAWSGKSQGSGDVVQAKLDINKNEQAQRNGVSWVFGGRAGGVGTAPLRPVRDLSVAGYNVTLNRATTSSATQDYSTSSSRLTRLVQTFKTPEALGAFTASVLGDQEVYLCNGISGCPANTSAATATGLGPHYDAEADAITPLMTSMANGSSGSYAALSEVGAPGMGVSPQLLEALRRLPPDSRAVAVNRLSQEMAMHRTVDKALVARNALLAGLSLPEVTAAGEVSKEVQSKVDRLTQYINDMMFEFRIRKEMTGETALTILGDSVVRGSQAMRVPDGLRADPNPVESGGVRK